MSRFEKLPKWLQYLMLIIGVGIIGTAIYRVAYELGFALGAS